MGRFFRMEMRVDSTTNFDIDKFAQSLTKVQKKVFLPAVNGAINKLGEKAQKKMFKSIVKEMGLKKKRLNKRYFYIQKSNFRTLSFLLSGRSRSLPMTYFDHSFLKASKREVGWNKRKDKKGFSARVMRGKRKKYKAFEVRLDSGHVGAFRREQGAERRVSRTGKEGVLPIRPLYGASIPTLMLSRESEAAWKEFTTPARLEKELVEQMRWRLIKAGLPALS